MVDIYYNYNINTNAVVLLKYILQILQMITPMRARLKCRQYQIEWFINSSKLGVNNCSSLGPQVLSWGFNEALNFKFLNPNYCNHLHPNRSCL